MSKRQLNKKWAILLVLSYVVVLGFSAYIFPEKIWGKVWILYVVVGWLILRFVFVKPMM